MSKKEIPKAVAEVLKQISAKVKEFNDRSVIKLVAKNSDDFLLKIYPKNNEDLFFQINSYKLDSISEGFKFTFSMSEGCLSLIIKRISLSEWELSILEKKYPAKTNFLIESIDHYILIQDDLKEIIDGNIHTKINLSELFEIDDEEEELLPERNNFESREKILPYSLKQLKVKDFQGVNQIGTSIDEISVDTQWIFLVGENGFGKTTILQSIFLGLNGALDDNTNLLDDKNSSIQVEYKNLEGSRVNSIKDNKHPLMHLAAYGPGRLNVQGVKSENAEDRNNSISYNLFNSDGFLFNINSELRDLKLKKEKRFDLLKRAICTLIPNLSDIKFNQDTDQIEYIEREINADDETITYKPLPFKKLASGFKSIIALAGDMIVRLSKNQPEVKDPSELKGIVIIDEIDLHLHPKLQKQLIGQFSKVFPKIQFIVSTHSPIPLLGAESNTVILKVNRTEAEGIKIEKVDIELKNLTPNLVLTSGIFDMEDFVSVQNEDISEVRTEDSMKQKLENDKVEQYLQEFEKSDNNFPDELFTPKSKK